MSKIPVVDSAEVDGTPPNDTIDLAKGDRQKLEATLQRLVWHANAIAKHLDNLIKISSYAVPPRKNRLGLSEAQIGILGCLYPDKMRSAMQIAESLGLSVTDKGKVPIEGQLKRDATLRRHSLIESVRGVEGGYHLTDLGRVIYQECTGMLQEAFNGE